MHDLNLKKNSKFKIRMKLNKGKFVVHVQFARLLLHAGMVKIKEQLQTISYHLQSINNHKYHMPTINQISDRLPLEMTEITHCTTSQ